MKFDFDDILLVPETISSINSRKEVNPFDENGMLPIFTAPMDTVVNEENCGVFIDNKIYTVLPRGTRTEVASTNDKKWLAYGLDEFADTFLRTSDAHYINEPMYVLIDVANGHMEQVHTYAAQAKKKFGSRLVLMVGNIANPKTFSQFEAIGVDYVRCGIGGGSGCLTSVQTGVGYPMGSLIDECYQISATKSNPPLIVADGGFKKYSDVIKALALGADYVMLGSILNKALESCGETYEHRDYYKVEKGGLPGMRVLEMNDRIIASFKSGTTFYKKYRGMSTKEVQRAWRKDELKTSEGIVKYNKVQYTLSTWAQNMEDYLRSAMSYTGSRTLEEFKASRFELITQNAFNRFNK